MREAWEQPAGLLGRATGPIVTRPSRTPSVTSGPGVGFGTVVGAEPGVMIGTTVTSGAGDGIGTTVAGGVASASQAKRSALGRDCSP